MDEARTQCFAHRSPEFLVPTLKQENPMNRGPSISLVIGIAVMISSPVWANATQCSNGGLTRSIEIVYSDPGHPVPCEVIYDKSAEGAGQHSLWRADSEAGYCEARAAAFVDKLRGFGWTCDAAAGAPAAEALPAQAGPSDETAVAEELLGESTDDITGAPGDG
jgi:hypothetical protein